MEYNRGARHPAQDDDNAPPTPPSLDARSQPHPPPDPHPDPTVPRAAFRAIEMSVEMTATTSVLRPMTHSTTSTTASRLETDAVRVLRKQG